MLFVPWPGTLKEFFPPQSSRASYSILCQEAEELGISVGIRNRSKHRTTLKAYETGMAPSLQQLGINNIGQVLSLSISDFSCSLCLHSGSVEASAVIMVDGVSLISMFVVVVVWVGATCQSVDSGAPQNSWSAH